MYDTIIIGGGPAGLAASIYLKRANKNVLIIEKEAPGGQLIKTHLIENYPGFSSIDGAELAYKMYEHVMSLDVEFAFEEVESVVKNDYFKVKTTSNEYFAKSVIYATGNKSKSLNIPGEAKFKARGISYCATCDGSLYKDKETSVIGSSHQAVEEAIYLSDICSKVYILSKEKIYIDLSKYTNIVVYEEVEVKEFIGSKTLEQVKIKTIDNQEILINSACAFVYLGIVPASNSVDSLNVVDSEGYLVVDENLETPVKGMFAAGDCVKKSLKQIVTAVSDGAIAATSAIKYLQKNK